MPQRRHCKRKLYNWSALQGHITLNVCNWYPRQAETTLQAHAQATPPLNPVTHVAASQPEPDSTQVPLAQATQPGPIMAANALDPPQQTSDKRPSAADEDSAPLLKQDRVLQHLQQHEGVLTQADLHRAHLSQHCGFCGRWIAEGGMIKTHILRAHKELAAFLTADFHKACTEFKYTLKRSQTCRWCGRIVHGTDRHCSQCPVLFQLLLAEIHRRDASISQETGPPQTWPMSCPAVDISACLADPLVDDNHDRLKDMALTAKTRCLLCGEPVQDIQAWRRHIKQKHGPQHEIARGIADSATVLNASITRPCPWCRVHFQKSARERRRKRLPLLQLGLRHDSITHAHGDDARAAAGGGLGTELPNCRQHPTYRAKDRRTSSGRQWHSRAIRKDVGKGAGKATPYAKRTREQEEEEELWMDSPGHGPDLAPRHWRARAPWAQTLAAHGAWSAYLPRAQLHAARPLVAKG